mgnify:CR=1 FL=1
MLELYTHPLSPCAQKVRIVLAEKNLAYVTHHIDLPKKENLKPDYLKLNPLGVVPTLVHELEPVIESSVICEYLDDAFPEKTLKPDSAIARAEMRLWMKHVDNKLHPSCGALQWPLVMRPKLMEKSPEERHALLRRIPEKPRRERQQRLVEMGLEAPDVVGAVEVYMQTISKMELALQKHRWLVSDSFSLADIMVAPYFQTVHQFDWYEMLNDAPLVKAWFVRCQQRDSYQVGVSSDFTKALLEDLKAKGDAAWEIIRKHLNKS